MSVTVQTAVDSLKSSSIADPSTHLKPKGRDEVAAEISKWEGKGLYAHVIVADPDDATSDLLHAYDQLGYKHDRDLLLVFNTKEISARGWVNDAQAVAIIKGNPPEPHQVFAARIINVLDALGRDAANERKLAPSPTAVAHEDSGGSSSLPIVGGVVGIGALGVIGLAILRRNRLAKEGLANVADAKKSAERAYTDLVLACEELPGDAKASEIQLKASDLKKRVDSLVADAEAHPAKGTDPVVIGKIRQLEDEMAALRSTVLQKEGK